MLFLATVRHNPKNCPGMNPEQFKGFLQRFSPENLGKSSVKLLSAYIDHSCLTMKAGQEHWTTFVLDSDSPESVTLAFNPIPMEVRQVIQWSNPGDTMPPSKP